MTLRRPDQLEEAVPEHWVWKGRHVHLVDGTTVTAPDRPENQAAYPQPPGQRPGLGFPMIRLVVLLSLTTALLGGLALGPYGGKEAGETALLRALRTGCGRATCCWRTATSAPTSWWRCCGRGAWMWSSGCTPVGTWTSGAAVGWAGATTWCSGSGRHGRGGWTRTPTPTCPGPWRSGRCAPRWRRRASAPRSWWWRRRCWTRRSTAGKTSPICTTSVGMWSWTSARSRRR